MIWTVVVVALVVAALATLALRVRRLAGESDHVGIRFEVANFVGYLIFGLGLALMTAHRNLGLLVVLLGLVLAALTSPGRRDATTNVWRRRAHRDQD